MKKLQASAFITSTVGFPPKSGTWDFLQQAYTEGILAAMITQIGESYSVLVPYTLYGCQLTSSGGITTIQPGAILLNGEFYILRSVQSFADPAGGNVVVGSVQTTQYTSNADPVIFTDSSSHNVHNINVIAFAAGAADSTIFDYSDLVRVDSPWQTNGLVLQSGWANNGAPDYNAAYKIVNGNQIFLSGSILKGGGYSGTVNVMQLPVTPTADTSAIIAVWDGSIYHFVQMALLTTGMVTVDTGVATLASIVLDSISFRIL